MQNETTLLRRVELYEQVWSTPITKLAKTYGLSDVGLAKICKKLKIPMPGRGYWQRGGRKRRVPLPPSKGPEEHIINKVKREELPDGNVPFMEEQAEIVFEKQPSNHIKVPAALVAPHELVIHTEKVLRNLKPDDMGRLRPRAENCLDLSVYPTSVSRAICLMDALIKGLDSRGYQVSINKTDFKTSVAVLGERLEISLEESLKRIDHTPTIAEKQEREKYPWMTYRKYDFIPSGTLSLKITTWAFNVRRCWTDGKRQRVEDCLNDFIIGLIKASAAVKSDRLEKERQERERQERERRRREREQLIWAEEKRIKTLESEATAWHRSQLIRAYVEAAKLAATRENGSITPGSPLDNWIQWAAQYADRLDPLTESPPSIFDEAAY